MDKGRPVPEGAGATSKERCLARRREFPKCFIQVGEAADVERKRDAERLPSIRRRTAAEAVVAAECEAGEENSLSRHFFVIVYFGRVLSG